MKLQNRLFQNYRIKFNHSFQTATKTKFENLLQSHIQKGFNHGLPFKILTVNAYMISGKQCFKSISFKSCTDLNYVSTTWIMSVWCCNVSISAIAIWKSLSVLESWSCWNTIFFNVTILRTKFQNKLFSSLPIIFSSLIVCEHVGGLGTGVKCPLVI